MHLNVCFMGNINIINYLFNLLLFFIILMQLCVCLFVQDKFPMWDSEMYSYLIIFSLWAHCRILKLQGHPERTQSHQSNMLLSVKTEEWYLLNGILEVIHYENHLASVGHSREFSCALKVCWHDSCCTQRLDCVFTEYCPETLRKFSRTFSRAFGRGTLHPSLYTLNSFSAAVSLLWGLSQTAASIHADATCR